MGFKTLHRLQYLSFPECLEILTEGTRRDILKGEITVNRCSVKKQIFSFQGVIQQLHKADMVGKSSQICDKALRKICR